MMLVVAAAMTAPLETCMAQCACEGECVCDPVLSDFAKMGGQVFFRFGGGFLTEGSRRGEAFVDTQGGLGLANGGDSGLDIGFGFELPLFKDPWFHNSVLGEVHVGYTEFSRKEVLQTTSALLGGTNTSQVAVTAGTIGAAPKYRFETGRLRPWVSPVGMEFIVYGPPSNDTTYLDVAIPFAVGVDYSLNEHITIGADCRYHLNLDRTNISSGDFVTVGSFVGFKF